MGESDTPLVNHLVLTEFVSGPPSYSSIHKRVGDRKPSHDLRESWWAVCGFRTEFFQGRQIFGSWFLFKYWVFGEHSPFVEIQYHMHMLRVYGHRRWQRSPRQVSTTWDGRAGSSPSTFTTSLAVLILSSSSSNGPTTTLWCVRKSKVCSDLQVRVLSDCKISFFLM